MAADRIVTLSTDPDMAPSDAGGGWWPAHPVQRATTAAARLPDAAAVRDARVQGAGRADAPRDRRRVVDAGSAKPAPVVPATKTVGKGWF